MVLTVYYGIVITRSWEYDKKNMQSQWGGLSQGKFICKSGSVALPQISTYDIQPTPVYFLWISKLSGSLIQNRLRRLPNPLPSLLNLLYLMPSHLLI